VSVRQDGRRCVPAKEQIQQQQSEREDIARVCRRGTGQALRGQVRRCAELARAVLQSRDQSGKAKVGDLHPAVGRHHHIGRFEVTVHDALLMCRGERLAELSSHTPRLVKR
jgi:hypothetical protein